MTARDRHPDLPTAAGVPPDPDGGEAPGPVRDGTPVHHLDGRFTLRSVPERSRDAALARDVRKGLAQAPRSLPPKWFYDELGSALFDQITRLPEYYPTRREREILQACGDEIVGAAGADVLIELGAGTSEKTRLLLDALARAGRLSTYVPVDVDPSVLRTSGRQLLQEYPGLRVDALCGDFETDLHHLPRHRRPLVAFLGGTIGNLLPGARARFLGVLRARMPAGASLLLGIDLVKDERRLLRAYDDTEGVTARFDLNVLAVLNARLGADFALDAFAHRAVWNAGEERIEMRLRSLRPQVVRLPLAGMAVGFAAGEEILTEVSCKFRRAGITAELDAAGWRVRGWWTDAAGDFALVLAARS